MENSSEDRVLERDFKGVWIPREIYLNDDLSWTEKILLIEIDSLDKGDGCWATNKYLSEFLSKSESQIANTITKLRKDGYIIDRSFDGRSRFISIREDLQQNKNRKAGLRKTVRQGYGKQEGRVTENRNEFEKNSENESSTEPQKEESDFLNNTLNNTSSILCEKNFSQEVKQELPDGYEYDYIEDSSGGVTKVVVDPSGKTLTKAQERRLLKQPQKPLKFEFESHLSTLSSSSFIPHRIIAFYWKQKGYRFENRFQADTQFKRDIKAAKIIHEAGYNSELIKRVAQFCKENYKEWTLETLLKKAPDFNKTQLEGDFL